MQAAKRYMISDSERRDTISRINACLKKAGRVSFGYVFGSFIDREGFNDIDVGVYFDETAVKTETIFDYQLELGVEIEREIGQYSIDCRALNIAPLSFRFSAITQGELVFSRDEEARICFEVMTRSLYFDFKPHAEFFYQKIALEG